MTGVRRLLFLLIMGLGGVSILAGLGVWQLQRLQWKNGLIANLETRLTEPAVSLEGNESPELNFTPAEASGTFVPPDEARQLRFLTTLSRTGPGFRIISVFELPNGERILVDRGFAPQDVVPRTAIPPAPPSGSMRVEGVLHWPRETTDYTPDPNLDEGIVFAREVSVMAEILDTRPVLLVADEPLTQPGARWPRPLPPSVDLPNDHLGYAITWFSMAAVWFIMTLFVLWRGRARG